MKPTVLLLAVLLLSSLIFSTNVSGCMLINSNDTYELVSNLYGAPISSSCIRITASNVELDCAGHSITNNGVSNAIGIYGAGTNITIKNCVISSYKTGISTNGFNSGFILNNTVSNASDRGIYLTQSRDNTLANNTVKDSYDCFYLFSANTKNNLVFNNTVSNCTDIAFRGFYLKNNTFLKNLIYNSNNGFSFEDATWNNLSGNRIYNITNSGVYLHGYDPGSTANNHLEHNIVGNSSTEGAFSTAAFYMNWYADNTTLINNTAYLAKKPCFDAYRVDRLTMIDNVAHSCTNGFVIRDNDAVARHHLLEGNMAYNNTNGFSISTARSGTIRNNLAYNNSKGFAISAPYYNVTENIACNNTRYGFDIQSFQNRIENNTLYNNTESGFYLSFGTAHTNTFTNNKMYENWHGFRAFWADTNTLINNTFYNNTISQINLEESDGYTISGTRILEGDAASYGYWLYNSHNNIITGDSISNIGTAFQIRGSHLNWIYNTTISGISSAQINETSTSYANRFINITGLDPSKFFASGGSNFFIGWYARTYVNDTAGNPVNGATAEALDSYSSLEWENDTDASGFTGWQISYEREYEDGSSPATIAADYNNHTATASLGTAHSSVSVNISGNTQINITLDLVAPCVTLQFPQSDTEYTTSTIDLNYTATDNVAIDSCWYTDASGANQTLPGCANSTLTFPASGNYNITVYANDTSGNIANASAVNLTATLPVPPSSKGGKDEDPLSLFREFECVPGTIEFHVYVGTKDISGATVKLFLKEGTWLKKVAENTTDKDGKASLSISAPGYYEAIASKDGYESKSILFTIEECPEEVQEAPPEEEPAEEPAGCTSNSDCSTTQRCVQGECTEIMGICGYAENHAWVEYECCADSDCGATERCEDYECIKSTYSLSVPNLVAGSPARIVVYRDGSPEPGAAVEVTFPDGSKQVLTTDSFGAIEFTPEQEGEYEIQIIDDAGNPLAGKGVSAQAPAPVSAPIGPTAPAPPAPQECCLLGFCSSILGVCWYWWLLGLILLAGAAAVLTGAITLGAGKPRA